MTLNSELDCMWSNHIIADEKIINKLSEGPRRTLINFLFSVYQSSLGPHNKKLSSENYIKNMRQSSIKFMLTYCPNCNDITLLCNSNTPMDDVRGLRFCINCGDTHFMDKAVVSKSRIKAFLDSINCGCFENELVRTLHLQQSVVMIATQLECFLKDYYAAVLNMRLIKFKQSAYQRFIKDCKNDFLNTGKGNKRLKDDLSLDLIKLVGKERYTILNKLSAYRNVIVHNNGLADSNFLSNSNTEYTLGEEIKIDGIDMDNFMKAFTITLATLMNIYSEEFIPILVMNINRYIPDIIDRAIYISKDNKRDLIKNLI